MVSGGQDTYLVVYDLVSDQALYKLMGHNEPVANVGLFQTEDPRLRGSVQTILVSGAQDGFLKFWDLQKQCCVLTVPSDELMTKVSDFLLIPELKTLVVGSGGGGQHEQYLKLFKIGVNPETLKLETKPMMRLKKETQGRVLELAYLPAKKLLCCMTAGEGASSQAQVGAKIEYFKVNIDNEESLLKKMARTEKRKKVKQAKKAAEDANDDAPLESKVDKDTLREAVAGGRYDVSMHFSKKAVLDLDIAQKVTRMAHHLPSKQEAKRGEVSIFLAAQNRVVRYRFDTKQEGEDNRFSRLQSVGDTLGSH
mmetsp:Transcript_11147/g.18705  ORF Transcript_11147/g.18705 Transcript_11147/m.18705 type:complete len:309 (-) Transcript_11147:1700-2626(-)